MTRAFLSVFMLTFAAGCCPPATKCATPSVELTVKSGSGATISELKVFVDGQEQFSSGPHYGLFVEEGRHLLSVTSSNHDGLQEAFDYVREEDGCGFKKPLILEATLQPESTPAEATLKQTLGPAGTCG